MIDKILRAIACICGICFVVSVSALDSDSVIPAVICFISITGLLIYTLTDPEETNDND